MRIYLHVDFPTVNFSLHGPKIQQPNFITIEYVQSHVDNLLNYTPKYIIYVWLWFKNIKCNSLNKEGLFDFLQKIKKNITFILMQLL